MIKRTGCHKKIQIYLTQFASLGLRGLQTSSSSINASVQFSFHQSCYFKIISFLPPDTSPSTDKTENITSISTIFHTFYCTCSQGRMQGRLGLNLPLMLYENFITCAKDST